MALGDYVDVPMSLGDHLEELRRRLKWPLIALGAFFMIAFYYENVVQEIFVRPLFWAIQINPEHAKAVGLPVDGTMPKLKTHDIFEAPLASMKVSFYTAFFLAFPVLIYHLWQFIGVGLVPRERRLAFLFVPAGIIFFYSGAVVGYFIGVPYLYSFLIKWAAHETILQFDLNLMEYHQRFVMMTIMFGAIADIPWLVMVMVRVGFVSVGQLLRNWKIAIIANTLVAAVFAPPDGPSMIALMIPMILLYFLGVGMSALMMRRHHRIEAEEQAAELARMAAEERAAHEAHAAHASQQSTHADVVPDASQPVPRSAIVDDLASVDHAPSSDDHTGKVTDEGVTDRDEASHDEARDPTQDGSGRDGMKPDGKDDNRV